MSQGQGLARLTSPIPIIDLALCLAPPQVLDPLKGDRRKTKRNNNLTNGSFLRMMVNRGQK